MPYFPASGLVKPCFAPGYVITSNRAPAVCISRLNASTCSGGTNGSAPAASTRMRALTLPDCAGEVVASAPWNVTTAARSAPARAMPSTTAPPKQYPIAAMRVVSTRGSCFSCSSAALNRAASTAGSLVTSLTNACASCGCVVTLPLPYMSSANPTYPASARRRAWLRACSLCPHHSCTTSTPGRLPGAASSQAMNPCSTVSPWRYSISRVFTVALPGDRVSKTAVIANPYRACMPRPPGAWFMGLRSETRLERLAVHRRGPIVARDQVRPVVPHVPHPGEVTPLPGVHPVHHARDESTAASVLPQLLEHER